MSLQFNPVRRRAVQGLAGLAAVGALPAWAQTRKSEGIGRELAVVQVADVSASQIDVSKDFVIGSRVAWQEINANGGVKGRPILHRTVDVDGSDASLREVLDTFKDQPGVVAFTGTVGGRVARRLTEIMRKDAPDMPHIAPWLQNTQFGAGGNTFPIFASRQDQITYAVRSLSLAGVSELGAVYATPSEHADYQQDVQNTAAALGMRVVSYGPAPDLQKLAQSLTLQSPRILIFLGGTPELLQFSRGIEKQAAMRYVVAMSDVNLQTLTQAGMSRHAPVIATQVVPLVNTSSAVVRGYRTSLTRLFDEPPTPQGLAGYIASRYVFETLQSLEGTVTRSSVMASLQKRSSAELGGFRIELDGKRPSGSFVTQSMMSPDGRIVG